MTENIAPLFPADALPPDEYESAVAACRAEMEAANLSITDVAREIGAGVSTTTASKWLRNVYEGDVPAVTTRVLAWLRTRRETARRAMSAAGLDRHVPLGVTEEIEAVLAHAQAAGDVVLIHGRSGAGKSWALARYCAAHTPSFRVAMTGAVVTLAGLLSRVAAAVGAGQRHGSALAAETAIVGRLQGRGALLVVDEAHHLSPRLLDELRCIRDLAEIGLALVGGDELWSALASSARCDQIVGRIGIRLPLGTAADAGRARSGRDGARAPAGGAASRKRLVAAARGAGGLHALRRLLARAWLLARGEGRDRIGAEDLQTAAEEGT